MIVEVSFRSPFKLIVYMFGTTHTVSLTTVWVIGLIHSLIKKTVVRHNKTLHLNTVHETVRYEVIFYVLMYNV